jgi:nucleoside-diphosphate-sugar epimerase
MFDHIPNCVSGFSRLLIKRRLKIKPVAMLSILDVKIITPEYCTLISFLAKASPLWSVNGMVLDAYIFNWLSFMLCASVWLQKGDGQLVNRVLVTGGAGFIGSHLVDRLLSEGFDVVVFDDLSSGRRENLSQHFGEANFGLVEGDVRDKAFVRKALEGVDVVFHLAAIVSVDFSVKDPLLVDEVNVGGTLNVLRESLKAGVKRFVYASSCAVYGELVHLPISEEHPTSPMSPYGVSKLAAEHYCRVFCGVYGFETVCLRFFNVYGSRQVIGPYSGVIMNFIDRLKRGEAPIIYGDGEQTRDFVFVGDVVDACLRAMRCKNCVGEMINVGSGVETTVNRLADVLIELFGSRDVKPVYAEPKAGDVRRSCADSSKAERLLSRKPKTLLREGLSMLLKSL